MRVWGRFLVGVSAVLVLAGLLYLAGPGYLARELGTLPEQVWRLEEARARGRELDGLVQPMVRVLKAKSRIVEDVLRGHLSLAEAAARFQALDRTRPNFDLATFCKDYPGDSEAESYCRVVLAWARYAVEGRHGQDRYLLHALCKQVGDAPAAVEERHGQDRYQLRRLEAELEEWLAGPRTLPW